MKRVLKFIALLVAALLVLVVAFVTLQANRRPDARAYDALVLPRAAADAPFKVTWAGVATLLFDDGETAWMTDGFFSRPGAVAMFTSRIAPDAAAVDAALARLKVQRLAAVVTVHAHYDHAMDSPLVAMRTGALLVGDESTMNIGRGLAMSAQRMRRVAPGDVVELGKWKLTFIASRHSPTLYSDGVTREEITQPLVPPARANEYREGQVWSILVEHASGASMLVNGSAGFIEGALKGRRADVVFMGVGALGQRDTAYREKLWQETVRMVGARRVIPIHWDDFWQPLEPPLPAFPYLVDDLDATMADLKRLAASSGVELRMPPVLVPFFPEPVPVAVPTAAPPAAAAAVAAAPASAAK